MSNFTVSFTAQELVQFVLFLFDRFAAGHEPTETQIDYALGDFMPIVNAQRHKASNDNMWPEQPAKPLQVNPKSHNYEPEK